MNTCPKAGDRVRVCGDADLRSIRGPHRSRDRGPPGAVPGLLGSGGLMEERLWRIVMRVDRPLREDWPYGDDAEFVPLVAELEPVGDAR